ncbi:MAG: hypothetical protein GY759_13190 [Chloroflexi bacterium]|nr:hypothetical protein [Chloroflexota bacterium]
MSQHEPKPEQPLSTEELVDIQTMIASWLDQQSDNEEFEIAWAGAGNLIGGGLINLDSEEEFDVIIYG